MKKIILIIIAFVYSYGYTCTAPKQWVADEPNPYSVTIDTLTLGASSHTTIAEQQSYVDNINGSVTEISTGSDESYQHTSTVVTAYEVGTPFDEPSESDYYYFGDKTTILIHYHCVDVPCPDSAIEIDGECIECPPHSAPNEDKTQCDCISPYIPHTDDNGTRECALPDDDTDGDGVPDSLDTDDDNDGYSDAQEQSEGTDPKNSSSNGSSSGGGTQGGTTSAPDGGGNNNGYSNSTEDTNRCASSDHWYCEVCTCSASTIIHYSGFFLNGVYTTGICPSNTKTYCETPNRGTPECNQNALHAHEHYVGEDCLKMCDEGYHYDKEQKCTSINDIPNDCSHPAVYGSARYPFQSYTNSVSACNKLINFWHTSGTFISLPSCDQGSVACYYNQATATESNDTNPNNDTNGTGEFDDTRIVERIDSTNTKLDFINNAISSQTDTLSDKLDTIARINQQTNNDIKNSVDLMNNSLGSKLDGITSAINNKPLPQATDMTGTNNAIDGLGDKLDAILGKLEANGTSLAEDLNATELEIDNEAITESWNNVNNVFKDTLVSFDTTRIDMINLFNGGHSPHISAGGNCVLSGTTKHLGSYRFDFSKVSVLRPGFQFILNLMLLVFTIKLYSRIARDLAKYFIGA